MKLIQLLNKRGQLVGNTMVDDHDYDSLSSFTWRLMRCGRSRYAVRRLRRDGKFICLMMHREILGLPPARDPQVDHKDMDGLNNQRSNLRLCTHSQNQWNRTAYRKNKTGFKGVLFHGGKYVARIRTFGKLTYLGAFHTPEMAHVAYSTAAKLLHGEFSNTEGVA